MRSHLRVREPFRFQTVPALLALVLVALTPGYAATDAASSSCVPFVPCADPRGCPDLVVDANFLAGRVSIQSRRFSSHDCAVQEGSTQAGVRRLLLFDTLTPNLGPGDLVIGNPDDHPEWFEFSMCHRHHHFKQYSDYRLWTPAGYQAWLNLKKRSHGACSTDLLSANPDVAAQMVRGDKRGFCVVDICSSTQCNFPCSFPVDPQKYVFCESFGQNLGNQGISVCWADFYNIGLDGQWIDITSVPAGDYILEVEVDAERFFVEADYSNNASAIQVTIPAP